MFGDGDARGASRTLQFVMLSGTVVLLSAIPTAYFLGFQPQTQPAPVVAGADVEVSDAAAPTVELSYVGGDPLELSAIEIQVAAECQGGIRSATLTSLPLDEPRVITSDAYSGDAILAEHSRLTVDTWRAGAPVEIELDPDECALGSGSEIRVEIVHLPSNAIVFQDAGSL